MKILYLVLLGLVIYLIYCIPVEKFTPVSILTNYSDIKTTVDLLRITTKFLKNKKIEYWIIGGTLLGSVRDGGMIPWDDDVDISIIKSNIPKLLKLKDELKKMNLGIVEWFGGYKIYDLKGKVIKGYNFLYPFVDIFVMIDGNDDDYIYEKAITRSYWNDHYYKKELYPLKEYLFEDFMVYGPNDPIPFLDKSFNNWRKTGMKTYDHVTHTKLKKIIFPIDYDKFKKPYLWLYFDNMTVCNKKCHQSVLKYCSNSFNIIILDSIKIHKYIVELKDYNLADLSNINKKYLYSIMLLYKYGGLYLDSEVIVLKDLSDVMNKLKTYFHVGYGDFKNPSSLFMASRPNNLLFGKTLDKHLKQIKSGDYDNVNHSLFVQELNYMINNQQYSYYNYTDKLIE